MRRRRERKQVDRGKRGHDEKGECKVVPPGEKTAVVFPSQVEEEDKRGRSLKKTDRKRGGGD